MAEVARCRGSLAELVRSGSPFYPVQYNRETEGDAIAEHRDHLGTVCHSHPPALVAIRGLRPRSPRRVGERRSPAWAGGNDPTLLNGLQHECRRVSGPEARLIRKARQRGRAAPGYKPWGGPPSGLRLLLLQCLVGEELPAQDLTGDDYLHDLGGAVGHLQTHGIPQALLDGILLAVGHVPVDEQRIVYGLDPYLGA